MRAVPRDYTSGSLGRAVLLLAVPMVLEMGMQSVFSVVDVYFVGRLGPEAVAVLGLSDSLIALVFAVSIGLSMGATAMVARRVGEGSPERASSAAVQAIAGGCAASLVIGVAGVVWASDLLILLGATPELAASGRTFTAIMLGGCVTVTLLFMINGIFRGAGDPVLAMRALWLANLVNIVLDPILIFGLGPIPAFGLEGAAIATTVGRGLGVAYQLRALTSGNGRVTIDWRRARIETQTMLRLLRVSGIGILQYLVGTASFVGLIRLLAPFGDTVLAGYTVAVRIIIFVLLPVWGVGNARRDSCGAEPGRRPAGSRRARGVVHRAPEHGAAGHRRRDLRGLRPVHRRTAGDRSGGRGAGRHLPAHRRLQLCVLGLRPRHRAGVQRSGGHRGSTSSSTGWCSSRWTLAGPAGLGPNGVFVTVAVCQTLMAVVGVLAFRRGGWKKRVL